MCSEIGFERAPGANKLDIRAILNYTLILFKFQVILAVNIGEAPLARDDDLLASRELVACPTQCFLNNGGIRILAANGEDNLANVDASDGAIRLAPCASHTGLQPISTCTGQHLVDTKDVERVYADSQVERVFASSLCDILVGADTGCLERLAR